MEKDETKEDDNKIQTESSSWGIKPKTKEINPSIEITKEKTEIDSWGTKPENKTKEEGWGSNSQQSTGGGWGGGQNSGGGWGSRRRSGGGWGNRQSSGNGWGSKNSAKSNNGWGSQTLLDFEINSWWWLKMMAKIIEATFHKMFEQYKLNQKSW